VVDFTLSQNVVRLSVPDTKCRKDVLASLILLVSRGSRTVSCLNKNADENPIIRQMPQVEHASSSTEAARIGASRLCSSTSTRDRARYR
jgi:hypothetical protein